MRSFLAVLALALAFGLSGCGAVLRADFDNDQTGLPPDRSLPGPPFGDNLQLLNPSLRGVFVVPRFGSNGIYITNALSSRFTNGLDYLIFSSRQFPLASDQVIVTATLSHLPDRSDIEPQELRLIAYTQHTGLSLTSMVSIVGGEVRDARGQQIGEIGRGRNLLVWTFNLSQRTFAFSLGAARTSGSLEVNENRSADPSPWTASLDISLNHAGVGHDTYFLDNLQISVD